MYQKRWSKHGTPQNAPISASAGRLAASRRWPDIAAPATRTGRLTVERGRKMHDRVPPNARVGGRQPSRKKKKGSVAEKRENLARTSG